MAKRRAMIRCYRGHYICSFRQFKEYERDHGSIADAFCNGCKDMVPVDQWARKVYTWHD